jgi:hypothetical protein
VAGFSVAVASPQREGGPFSPQDEMWSVVDVVDVVSTDCSERRDDPKATGEKAAICWQAAKRKQAFIIMVMILTATVMYGMYARDELTRERETLLLGWPKGMCQLQLMSATVVDL